MAVPATKEFSTYVQVVPAGADTFLISDASDAGATKEALISDIDTALGLGTMSTQAANSVAITGGTADSLVQTLVDINSGAIDGTTIGATNRAPGSFTGVTVTNDVDAGGTVTAANFVGDGSALTGITGATGGVSNTGSTTIGADTDADGLGEIALQTRGTTRLTVTNAGQVGIGGTTLDNRALYVEYNGNPAQSTSTSSTRQITPFIMQRVKAGGVVPDDEAVIVVGMNDGFGSNDPHSEFGYRVDGTVAANAVPMAFLIRTGNTPDGGIERVRWTSSGHMIFGGTRTIGVNNPAVALKGQVNDLNFEMQGTSPNMVWHETDGTLNNKTWDVLVSAEAMKWRILSDDASVQADWLTIQRTGTTIDSVTIADGIATMVMPGIKVATLSGVAQAVSIESDTLWFGSDNTGIRRLAADELSLVAGGGSGSIRVDANAVAGNTRMLVYNVDDGTLKRVKAGALGTGPTASDRMLYI